VAKSEAGFIELNFNWTLLKPLKEKLILRTEKMERLIYTKCTQEEKNDFKGFLGECRFLGDKYWFFQSCKLVTCMYMFSLTPGIPFCFKSDIDMY
jgi:hypothetical protein